MAKPRAEGPTGAAEISGLAELATDRATGTEQPAGQTAEGKAEEDVPLRIRLIHDANDKPLTIVKGQVVSVALPRVSTSARGNPFLAGLGEIMGKMEMDHWDDLLLPQLGTGERARVDFLTQALSKETKSKGKGAVSQAL